MSDSILDEFEPTIPERKYKLSTKLLRTYAKSTDKLREIASTREKWRKILASASNRPGRRGRAI